MWDPYNVEIEDDIESHRFSLLLKRLINFKTVSTFMCRNALGFDFDCSNSLLLFGSPLKHLLLALNLKKFLAKFSSIFAWDLANFISQMGCCSRANCFTSIWTIYFLREMGHLATAQFLLFVFDLLCYQPSGRFAPIFYFNFLLLLNLSACSLQ